MTLHNKVGGWQDTCSCHSIKIGTKRKRCFESQDDNVKNNE